MDDQAHVDFDLQGSGIEEAIRVLQSIKDKGPKAIANAMNATATFLRDDAARQVAKVYVADKNVIKRRMQVSKAGPNKLQAFVSRTGPAWTARWFPYDPNTMPGRRGGRAATSRPRRDGGGKYLDAMTNRNPSRTGSGNHNKLSKAFVARLPTRGVGVYRRIVGKKNSDVGKEGYSGGPGALTNAHVLTAQDMLADPDVRSVVQMNAARKYHKELDRQIKQLLDRG